MVTWRYVPSDDNPADLASRGLAPDALHRESKWWAGPSWLALGMEHWPQSPQCLATLQVAPLQNPGPPQTASSSVEWIDRFSSLGSLTRVVARCLRWSSRRRPQDGSQTSPFSAAELSNAFLAYVRLVQEVHFPKEISLLREGHGVHRGSPLARLDAILDSSGILRVGGRLDKAHLPYAQRHPAILPKSCHLTRLVNDRAHRLSMHGGHSLTYAYAVRNIWIIGGRALVRAFVRSCVICARGRPRPSVQLMGDLPEQRVTIARAFARTGLDYAGPFYLKASAGRGIRTSKVYLAVFVCLSTRAVHLEIVGDLTTESFLAALRHFAARRGAPSEIWSDNATTFHGADAELREMLRKAELDWRLVSGTLASEGIGWHFIPPTAPHFGGLCEAAVKSAKSHLKKVLRQRPLTYEEMSTLSAQIEHILNSRPLIPISGDLDDLALLTPGHFLVGSPLNAIPEVAKDDLPPANLDYLRHWRLVQAVRKRFWVRWSRDYLNTLQQRIKWQGRRPNLDVGDIVLILDPSLLRLGRWPLARITAPRQ